jgi:hypothetical protein
MIGRSHNGSAAQSLRSNVTNVPGIQESRWTSLIRAPRCDVLGAVPPFGLTVNSYVRRSLNSRPASMTAPRRINRQTSYVPHMIPRGL